MKWRTITIDGMAWEYSIGRQSVVARSENGDKVLASYSEISGWSPDEVERGLRKGTFHLTPSMIEAMIRAWK
jgi:hypothetical protein